MKRLLKILFPEKSKWVDIGVYDKEGYYILIQMRCVIHNNKKQFRRVNLGFINSYDSKEMLYKNIASFNS